MAVYKVAQDVEADDKLLGPFTFRQFIYLIIVAISGALAYGLSRIFAPLFIIPVPVILFFGALALPLRKDQPMEVYLAALVSFYLKPRRRLWIPDGTESLIEITAPKVAEIQRTKDISQSEAESRLSYLANIVDSQGWALRHVTAPEPDSSMTPTAFYEAQATADKLDDSGAVALGFDAMITESAARNRQTAIDRMQQAVTLTSPSQTSLLDNQTYTPTYSQPADNNSLISPASTDDITYNPYPTNIRQSVIQPLSQDNVVNNTTDTALVSTETATATPTTSDTVVSSDIINLARNTDLTIETLAREANRSAQKSGDPDSGEVFISLR